MTELDPDLEERLAELNPAEWHALVGRVRPPEDDPKTRAAQALRDYQARGSIESLAKDFANHERPLQ
jgi:hypothetical protein